MGHFLALRLNNVWAWCFFTIAFLPLKREWRFKLDKKQQYILCANHFSYLDIPSLGLFPKPFKFVGKSQLSKVPVFGFMYNNLHITVNRSSVRSRGMTLKKARAALENGFNLGFFPEGGIRVKEFPHMIDFQDGAFRLAAENDLAVVPITFLDNYNIFFDDDLLNMRRRKCRIVYHKPIKALDNSEEEIKKLKAAVHRVIQDELNAHHLSPKTETSA
ncbi:MAG: lysophospholipid acyltransferase family protein [Cyclobacteriaceae bacterium]